MVSKSTSILLAVAVVAVSAVAIIGLGYAYTASTVNSGNDTTASYLLITQTDYDNGFEDNRVVFSTSNPAGEVTYTFDGVIKISNSSVVPAIKLAATPEGGYYSVDDSNENNKVYELGDSLFTITATGMATIPNYSLNIAATGLDTTHYAYFFSLNNEAKYYAFTGNQSVNVTSPEAASSGLTIHIYCKVVVAPTGDAGDGFDQPLKNSTFTITATVS